MNKTLSRLTAITSTIAIAFVCVINLFSTTSAYAALGDYEVNDPTAAAPKNTAVLAEQMVQKFNELRAILGLKPVYIVPYLNEVAETRAAEQAESYSHTRPDGTPYVTAINRSLINFIGAGETLAKGSSNVDVIFNAWKASPLHWHVITRSSVTHIGIGVVYKPESDRKWYWSAVMVEIPAGTELEGQRMPDAELLNSLEIKAPETVPTAVIGGDLTGDGIIDCFDLIIICQHLNGTVELTEAQLKAADVVNDGMITELDANYLRKYILGVYTDLPVITQAV